MTSEDLMIIKRKKAWLYEYILRREIYGYCYSTSFEILRTLQKGKVTFLAIDNLPFDEKDYKDHKKTGHAVFEKDDYVFDPYTGRQHKKKDFISLFEAEEYRSFCYEDIKDLTYEGFRIKYGEDFANWCKTKSYSQKFSL